MANYKQALEYILKNEGVFSNDSLDSGGRTVRGISENNWPDWKGWAIIDAISGSEIETNAEVSRLVEEFYLINFWKPIMGDSLLSQDVATAIFDFGINTGIKTAVKLAQQIVGIEDDGILGQKTVYMLNTCSPKLFIAEYKLKNIARYCDIVGKKPSQIKYLRGWILRALLLLALFSSCRTTKKVAKSEAAQVKTEQVTQVVARDVDVVQNNDVAVDTKVTVTETEYSAPDVIESIRVTVTETTAADKSVITTTNNDQIKTDIAVSEKTETKTENTEEKKVPIRWGNILGLLLLLISVSGFLYWKFK